MTHSNSGFIAAAFAVGFLFYFGYFGWLLLQNKKLRAFAELPQSSPKWPN